MDRIQYWDEKYLSYWKSKVNEANSDMELSVNKNDVKTISDDLIFKYCDLISIIDNAKVLDFGCGFCRSYPYFKNKKTNYYGIDISKAMINEAINKFPELKNKLTVSEGENLKFEDLYFDLIVCFGVFDACYQEEALKEMLRALKLGGMLILTGKNTLYFSDDNKALVAEINARAKGHPNYFTNTKNLITQLKQSGFNLENEFYFLRRGDFQEMRFVKEIPDRFYEYALIIKKTVTVAPKLSNFSCEYSDTYREIYQ